MTTHSSSVHGEAWTSIRFSLTVDQSYEGLVDSFERAVPPYPTAVFREMVARSAPWQEVVDVAENQSPLGLLLYWKDDVTPMMALAGDTAKCVVFFIGNFPVAERMYRHDPRVMQYAPIRVTITESPGGVVQLTTEKPSGGFASFGQPAITAVGNNVDLKIASLLEFLHVDVPAGLVSQPDD